LPAFSYTNWLADKGITPGRINSITAKELLDDAGVAAFMKADKCYRQLLPYGVGWNSGM